MSENKVNTPPIPVNKDISLQLPSDKQIRNAKIQLAKDILRGVHGDAEDMDALYRDLKKYGKFGLARKILFLLRKEKPNVLKLYQEEALCTYKDPDLPSEEKFKMAIAILREVEDINTTENTETLGLLGSIYKRKWQYDNQFFNLKKSKYYYYRGYKIWLKKLESGEEDTDLGYTGINAAYVIDLMAGLQWSQVEETGDEKNLSEILAKIQLAKDIRKKILNVLSDKLQQGLKYNSYWVYTTLVEACIALSDFETAKKYWLLALSLHPDNWQLESSKVQFISLGQILLRVKTLEEDLKLRLKKPEDQNGENLSGSSNFSGKLHHFLESVLEVNTKATEKVLAGKVGLALSGGGFRAALYHIGVLAKMAEFDLLKHVEVLSCVSGGSIIGAYYYLKLLLLFEQKADEDIGQEDYIRIVKEIEVDFLNAVKKDIRGQLFINPLDNLKMAFSKSYSRTNRLASLYEKHFYKKLFAQITEQRKKIGIKSDWTGPIRMSDLFFYPKNWPIGEFNPIRDNWKRNNKVPILIINATTLNTAHNWQFTASWMGEPPGNIIKEVDAKYRLRRMYYWEAPGKYKNLGLSEAVAASSGVPGLFPPLTFDKLYPNQTVRLVDGGVHDNQGIVGLTEQECQILFISDSSGQLMTVDDLGKNAVSVLSRTNSVLMERVRECQYLDLKSRSKTMLIKSMMFVHLRKGLMDKPLDWIHCEDPHDASDSSSSFYEKGVLTKYNIRKDVQQLLASVRTDLDAFNDAEAYALMYSGYKMTEYEHLQKTSHSLPDENSVMKKETWEFEKVEDLVKYSEQSVWIKKILSVGQGLLFKSFRLSNNLMIFAVIFGLAVVSFITFLFYQSWNKDLFDLQLKVSDIGTSILWILGGLIAGKLIISILQYKDTLRSAIRNFLVAITGSLVSSVISPILNRVYLKYGSLKEKEKKKNT